MAKYDLTGGLETKFTFTIDNQEYEFRKPTVREMRAMLKKFSAVEKEKNPDKQLAASDEAMAEMYTFIVPVGHDTLIADAMDNQTVATQKAFNDMIKKELGAES